MHDFLLGNFSLCTIGWLSSNCLRSPIGFMIGLNSWLQFEAMKFRGTSLMYIFGFVNRYSAVIDSWALAFNWGQGAGGAGQGVGFQLQDVRARVLSDMAWITFKVFADVDAGPFHVTNVYEFQNGRWYMVHHHSSPILLDGAPNQFNFLGWFKHSASSYCFLQIAESHCKYWKLLVPQCQVYKKIEEIKRKYTVLVGP